MQTLILLIMLLSYCKLLTGKAQLGESFSKFLWITLHMYFCTYPQG